MTMQICLTAMVLALGYLNAYVAQRNVNRILMQRIAEAGRAIGEGSYSA